MIPQLEAKLKPDHAMTVYTIRWELTQPCLRKERAPSASDEAVPQVAAGDCFGANGAPRSDK